MRAYALMLIVFIFTASLSFVNTMGLVTGGIGEVGIGESGQSPEEYVGARVIEIGNLSDTASSTTVDTQETFSWYNAVYKIVIIGIPTVVKMFFDSTVGLPFMLMAIGVPVELAVFISLFAWVIYIIGMIQWITNRSFKQHD